MNSGGVGRELFLHYISKHPTGMYGVLLDDELLPFAVSLQPNDKYLPIPGIYKCKKGIYHHGGYETFEIIVEGHTLVFFHKGNHQEDSKLCVLLGEAFQIVDGRPGISMSGIAFEEFWKKYKDCDEFELIVTAREGIQ